jgi:type 1 fimbriae regulatory protein FimB/type 1 fimbriae regulatory protein FimE
MDAGLPRGAIACIRYAPWAACAIVVPGGVDGQLRRENLQSRFVFNTERGGPVTRAWFLKMVRRTGELAKLPFSIHPHMLRHGCGFKLANDGVDTRALQHFLGHRNIMHTVRYTELRSDRFDGFWKD